MIKRMIKSAGLISFFTCILLGGLAACSSKRPLMVPTTPPSENKENPGPDAPPVSDADCENPEDCFDEGVRRWNEKDHDGARVVLDSLRYRFPKSIWAYRSGFLLGRWSSEIGSPFADRYFRDVSEKIPALKPYIRYYSALAQFNRGRFGETLALLARFQDDFPGSVLNNDAGLLRMKALVAQGRCALAFPEEDSGGEMPSAELLMLQAECAEQKGDMDQYARLLQKIWFYKPETNQAGKAWRLLGGLKSRGFAIPEPLFEARLERANYLMSAARFQEAESAFASLARDFPEEFRDSLRISRGEALFRMRRNEQAIRLFKEVAEDSEDPGEVHRSLFWLARIALRQDEDSRLMEIEKELAERAPGSPERIRALFYVGDAFDDSGDRENASKIYRRIMEEYPATQTAAESAWRLGWMAYRHGDYDEALRVFGRFVKGNPTEAENDRYWYWIGRSADQSGKGELAQQAYQKTCGLRRLSFYCQLAMSRIQAESQVHRGGTSGVMEVSFPRDAGVKELNRAVTISQNPDAAGLPFSDSPGFLAARELLVLKMVPEATRELSLLALNYKDPGSILFLSGLFSKMGDPYRSMRLVRLYLNNWILDKSPETPLWFWELAFPSSIVLETLEKYPVSGLDPYLVSAVIREESAFNPTVVSQAGAIGLMQLMPYTGKRVARETGLGDIREGDLKDPTLNIRLGSRYLKSLIGRFNGNWVLAVAAYNAGPEAVAKWVGDGIGDMEEFIESIPYRETRNYTKRVSQSYYEYKRISKPDMPESSLRSHPFFP